MTRIISSPIFRTLAVHLGFHTFWVLLPVLGLLGFFMIVPLVGTYNTFVLGFMGSHALNSPTQAALFGYLVFAVTGLLFGCFISILRLKSVRIPPWFSLVLTCILLFLGASWRHQTTGVVARAPSTLPVPASTGRADVLRLSMALQTEYNLMYPAIPPHLRDKETIVPFSELVPALRLLHKGFQLTGGPHVYCNLPSQLWRELKEDTTGGKSPLLWSTQSDATGRRLVVSVDLKTDQFSDEFLAEEKLTQMLTQLETSVRKQTGDTNFTLRR